MRIIIISFAGFLGDGFFKDTQKDLLLFIIIIIIIIIIPRGGDELQESLFGVSGEGEIHPLHDNFQAFDPLRKQLDEFEGFELLGTGHQIVLSEEDPFQFGKKVTTEQHLRACWKQFPSVFINWLL